MPYAERAYYEARPTIAIGRPGTDQGALPLDGHFGLHPALAGLLPLWNDKKLAFVHAAGSPDPTRSHFDAQLFIENGTPGRSTTPDGWMNRLLAALPEPHGPTDAVSVGPTSAANSEGSGCRSPICRSARKPPSRCRSTGRRSPAPSTASIPGTTR